MQPRTNSRALIEPGALREVCPKDLDQACHLGKDFHEGTTHIVKNGENRSAASIFRKIDKFAAGSPESEKP